MVKTVQSTVISGTASNEKSHTATPPRSTTSKIKKEGSMETRRYIVKISGAACKAEISASKNNKIIKNKKLKTLYRKKEYTSNFNFKALDNFLMYRNRLSTESPFIRSCFFLKKYPARTTIISDKRAMLRFISEKGKE